MTAFSVPQHKLRCTIAFGGSVRIERVSACLRKGRASLFIERERERYQASAAVSATCLSTSVPHSSGTCLETGIYTTVSCGSRALLAERKDQAPGLGLQRKSRFIPTTCRRWKTGQQKKTSGMHSQLTLHQLWYMQLIQSPQKYLLAMTERPIGFDMLTPWKNGVT